ncbi:GSCOCG00007874001-RA-CDS [Cotesia congregata]|nr:GSCOCG00007874001-RA-CDS [Cotesia congregata]
MAIASRVKIEACLGALNSSSTSSKGKTTENPPNGALSSLEPSVNIQVQLVKNSSKMSLKSS